LPVAFKAEAIGKWFALQIASHAFSFVIGLSVVTGAFVGFLTWAEELPLSLIILSTLVAMAAMATILNQIRVFLVACNMGHRFIAVETSAEPSRSASGKEGYGLGILFRNMADIPLEYSVEKVHANLDGMIASKDSKLGQGAPGSIVKAYEYRIFRIGVAETGLRGSATMYGEIEITYSFGRPGKLKHRRTDTFAFVVVTYPDCGVGAIQSRSSRA
jgi:hypothetical protein